VTLGYQLSQFVAMYNTSGVELLPLVPLAPPGFQKTFLDLRRRLPEV
jgi:hypothetical protein